MFHSYSLATVLPSLFLELNYVRCNCFLITNSVILNNIAFYYFLQTQFSKYFLNILLS